MWSLAMNSLQEELESKIYIHHSSNCKSVVAYGLPGREECICGAWDIRDKEINALSQLFYTKMEEIISADEDTTGGEGHGNMFRNALRSEQRKKLLEVMK